jgi:hypothetical protein
MIKSNYEEWPIVTIVSPPTVTDEEMANHLAEFSAEVKRRKEPCVVVLDLQECEKLSVTQRKMTTENMLEMDARNQILGCAMVFESRLLRGILTAMFWVHRPRYPTRIFNTLAEARDWADMLSNRVRGQEEEHPRLANALADPTQRRAPAPSSSLPPFAEDLERNPRNGAWIIHFDASRSRDRAAEMVDALRLADRDAYLCERRVSSDLSLWLGWTGPYGGREDAFAARDALARRGVLLTVSRWEAALSD